MKRAGSLRRIWLWPLMLTAISVFGLLSALLGDGWWDVLSWMALSIPVAVAIWFGLLA